MRLIFALIALSSFLSNAYTLPSGSQQSWKARMGASTSETGNHQYTCFNTHDFPLVSFTQCRTTFDALLRTPGAWVPHHYQGITIKPAYLSHGPCTIMFGTRKSGTEIDLSIQQTVSFARDILTACRSDRRGGINYINPTWYVAVRGGKASTWTKENYENSTLRQH